MPVPAEGRDMPSFSMGQEELPEVKYWEVGGKYYLVVKVEMVEQSNSKAYGYNDSRDKGKIQGRFKMLNIMALKNTPVDAKSLEEKDFKQTVAKVRSGGA